MVMSSTRHSPWERATRGQAAQMAMQQQNQLSSAAPHHEGRVRHWQRQHVLVNAIPAGGGVASEHMGSGSQQQQHASIGGFGVPRWIPTDEPLPAETCVPPKGVEPVRVPIRRERSPSPDQLMEDARMTGKLPPRRSSRLSLPTQSMTQATTDMETTDLTSEENKIVSEDAAVAEKLPAVIPPPVSAPEQAPAPAPVPEQAPTPAPAPEQTPPVVQQQQQQQPSAPEEQQQQQQQQQDPPKVQDEAK